MRLKAILMEPAPCLFTGLCLMSGACRQVGFFRIKAGMSHSDGMQPDDYLQIAPATVPGSGRLP
jgi:hypothetical protein